MWSSDVVVQWEYVKAILYPYCFHNKRNEYLHVHLLLKITTSLKLEYHPQNMLNKIGGWSKEGLMFSRKIACFRSFLYSFTGEYCLLPDTILKVIILISVHRSLYFISNLDLRIIKTTKTILNKQNILGYSLINAGKIFSANPFGRAFWAAKHTLLAQVTCFIHQYS